MTETQAPLVPGGGLDVGDAPTGRAASQKHTLPDLERLSLGEMPPDEAGQFLATMLEEPTPKECKIAYEALGALAWKQSAERVSGEPVRAWHELFRYAAGLIGDAGESETAAKLLGVADQSLRWLRHGLARPPADLRRRAHESEIVALLHGRGVAMWREEVGEKLGLKQGNLTRVLANLATSGLVERRHEGRRQLVCLTAAGREAYRSRIGSRGLTADPPIEKIP